MTSAAATYRGHRFPPEIIGHAVWLDHRFSLSFRDVEDLLAQRGVIVFYEPIRSWWRKFGPTYAAKLRRQRGRLGDIWHLDEVFVSIRGRRYYLRRAVVQDGDVLDILVQPRRDRCAAERFFRKLSKNQAFIPTRIVTDQLGSYRAARRTVMPSVPHDARRRSNNRTEASHQASRRRERQMQRFKSPGQAQVSWRSTRSWRICSGSVGILSGRPRTERFGLKRSPARMRSWQASWQARTAPGCEQNPCWTLNSTTPENPPLGR